MTRSHSGFRAQSSEPVSAWVPHPLECATATRTSRCLHRPSWPPPWPYLFPANRGDRIPRPDPILCAILDVMNLEVDPGLLAHAAADVATVQDRLQTVFDNLRSDLASRGTSWAKGSFGTAFADGAHGYLAAKDQLFQSAQNLAVTLGHYSSAMSSAANAWAIADGEPAAGTGDA